MDNVQSLPDTFTTSSLNSETQLHSTLYYVSSEPQSYFCILFEDVTLQTFGQYIHNTHLEYCRTNSFISNPAEFMKDALHVSTTRRQ